jgi:hypothetical protein
VRELLTPVGGPAFFIYDKVLLLRSGGGASAETVAGVVLGRQFGLFLSK